MLRLLTALSVLLAVSLALGQDESAASRLKVVFGSAGECQVWFLDADLDTIGERVNVTGSSVELEDVPSEARYAAARELDNNRMARAEIKGLKGTWAVTEAHWKFLHEVKVSVVHEFEPVQTGLVTLSAGDYKDSVLLSAEDQGNAIFHGVPDRQMAVSFEYKFEGEQKKTPLQTFVQEDAGLAVPTLTVSVNDPVPTGGVKEEDSAEEAAADGGAAESRPIPRDNPWQKVVGMLVGLALLGGVVYGLIWYFKNKPQDAKDLLGKAGIEIPEKDDDAGDADPPAVPSQPEPLKKIILDKPIPGDPQSVSESMTANLGAAAGAASPGAVANPRFVRDDGSVFMIPEGTSSVGREADRDFPLTGESSVSRTHAQLSRTGDSVTVTDQGSTNGTWVNGSKAEGPTTLKPGDMVTFGGVHVTYEE